MRSLLFALLLGTAALSASDPAFAGDDDKKTDTKKDDKKSASPGTDAKKDASPGVDLLGGDDDDDDTPATPRPSDDDTKGQDTDEPEPDTTAPSDTQGDNTDLLGDEVKKDQIGGPGEDTAEIYRKYQEAHKNDAPDEEEIAWERYLQKYPNSHFKDRIEQHMQDLEDSQYTQPQTPTGDNRVDADKREIYLAQGLLLENMNPRTRMQTGFEWGLPNWINLYVDYERQVKRTLSFHGGVAHSYSGWRIDAGTKWAFVKSSRTQTVVSLLGDVALNANPAYPILRPELALGKKLGPVDLQLQGGVEVDTRAHAGIREVGGLNVTYKASDTVGMFLEGDVYMKTLGSDLGKFSFRFNQTAFGLKFYPEPKGLKPGQLEVNLGATVPVGPQYWQFNYGSIMGQVNYYMK